MLVAVTARSVRRISRTQPLVQRTRPEHEFGDRDSGDRLIPNQVAIGVQAAFIRAAQTDDGSRYFPSVEVGVLLTAADYRPALGPQL